MVFHGRKARTLMKKIEEQKVLNALLERNGSSLFKDLYNLEHKGYPVFEVLKGYSRSVHVGPYKEYVKGKYHEAQDRFDIPRKLLDGHCAIELAKKLRAIEALPTGKVVMLDMKMDMSG
jgi:hypothetical protein